MPELPPGAVPVPLWTAAAFVLGLLVGSFLNVVALRLPRRMEHEWRRECRELLEQGELELEAPPDLVRHPSHCPGCGHRIRWYENIPVLSWLALRGRCSACGAGISLQYPLVELLTGVLTAICVAHLGAGPEALGAMILTWYLVALALIDLREQLLPDSLTIPLLWIGLGLNAAGVGLTDLHSAVWGAIGGYLALWAVFHLFRLLTGKEGMGFGDFKLLAALGAWLGWQALPVIIVLSSFVGAVIGIASVLFRGRDKDLPIPFGPYLAAAGWIALLWGDEIVGAYLQVSGITG